MKKVILGRDVGHPSEAQSKGEALKETSSATGKKSAGDLLTQNTRLSSKLQGLLPAGTNLQDAASGFDHLGQFVSAVMSLTILIFPLTS